MKYLVYALVFASVGMVIFVFWLEFVKWLSHIFL